MTAPSIGCRSILTGSSPAVAIDASVNPTADWACFVGVMPDGPGKAICFTDVGGLASDPRWLLDQPTVAVMVRSNDYVSGWNKMKDIREALIGLAPQTIGGDKWNGVMAIGNFAYIGVDAKSRPMFSANFRLIVLPAASTVENRSPL